MTFSLRDCELNKLNSLTKYPSIPTYHTLGEKGSLLADTIGFAGDIILTEKVDGTNSRIILLPDGNFVLGSREELLFAKGDLIGNPAMGIADALKDLADSLPCAPAQIQVLYLELYGGKITAASKQYTSEQSISWRLFDIAIIENIAPLFSQSLAEISAWRERGGQSFLNEEQLVQAAENYGLTLTPRIATIKSLPSDIEETYEFLKQWLPKTQVAIDAGAGGKAEGIVARTVSRSAIAKLRFEDYERHVKRTHKKSS